MPLVFLRLPALLLLFSKGGVKTKPGARSVAGSWDVPWRLRNASGSCECQILIKSVAEKCLHDGEAEVAVSLLQDAGC